MIEQLNRKQIVDECGTIYGYHNITESEFVNKINELIERVNKLEKEINQLKSLNK